MKTPHLSLLVIFLVLLGSCTKEDNYIKYYNLCNLGDKEKYFENYDKALEYYQTAFKEVGYVHSKNYTQAAECAMQIEAYDLTSTYYKNAISNGFIPLSQLGNEKFKNSPEGKQLAQAIPSYLALANEKINQPYKAILDSLYYVDQVIIRGSASDDTYNIDRSTLPADLFELDQQIFSTLMNLVVQYGFPSEDKVGVRSSGKANIIFHHNIRLTENNHYMDFAIHALKTGKYPPSSFAWMYDQSLIGADKEPLFYYGVPGFSSLSEEDKKMIDIERAKYGIKPLASTKIEESEFGTSMTTLW